MRLALLSCTTVLAVLLVGCSTSERSRKTTGALDSLRTENIRLRDQNRSLRDSIQFYADIKSGQYHRDIRSLEDRLARLTYEVELLRDGGRTVSVLPTDSLFATTIDSLSAQGTTRLKRLAHQLKTTYPNRTIWVEGHTDNRPVPAPLAGRVPSNWALSSTRAAVVVRRLVDLTGLDPSQFVAVGYGPSHPRTSNNTPGGRRRNRRVRVAVFPRPKTYSRSLDRSW